MKGTLYYSSPPGYVTVSEAARQLGKSRQLLYKSGLTRALDRWQVGRVTLYRLEDVEGLARWLFVREGLVALSLRPANYPLNPDDGEYYNAVEEGYWDVACSACRGDAVGEPLGGRAWCPKCGIVE